MPQRGTELVGTYPIPPTHTRPHTFHASHTSNMSRQLGWSQPLVTLTGANFQPGASASQSFTIPALTTSDTNFVMVNPAAWMGRAGSPMFVSYRVPSGSDYGLLSQYKVWNRAERADGFPQKEASPGPLSLTPRGPNSMTHLPAPRHTEHSPSPPPVPATQNTVDIHWYNGTQGIVTAWHSFLLVGTDLGMVSQPVLNFAASL